MIGVIEGICWLGGLCAGMAARMPAWFYPAYCGGWIAVHGMVFGGGILGTCFFGGLSAVSAGLLLQTAWRRQGVLWIMQQLRGILPPISRTEREAILAGQVWWEGSLFSGDPDWKQLQAWRYPAFTPEEQAFLDTEVVALCRLLSDWEITQVHQDLPPEIWDLLKREKFLGMTIPTAYGGLGFSATLHSEVITRIATCSVSAAVGVMVPNSLGPAELLMHYGTQAQRDYFLPRLAVGTEIPCFALTGPESGSDAATMPDEGVVVAHMVDGQVQHFLSLTWNKRYITMAPIATLLGLAFRLRDPDHLLSETTERGITLALIPTDHPGVQIGDRHFPLNAVFMNGPTAGSNVLIPIEWIIGGVEQIGQGWRMLMECLSAGRGISLPALSAAAGAVALQSTSAYARIRTQFRLPIGKFEGVSEVLARIAGGAYMLDAMRLFTTMAIDSGAKPSVASAIAKYHMTEWARQLINDAMDIHAGKGIMLGPSNYLARIYQVMPVSITVEGANILTRSLMIFGQGALRCHPYLLAEMEALSDPDPQGSVAQFEQTLAGHLQHTAANLGRAVGFGWSRGLGVSRQTDGVLEAYYRRVTWMSALLAVMSDVALLWLGGSLKRKESLSARLGDWLSQLHLASAVLHAFEVHGQQASERPYVEWVLDTLFARLDLTVFGFFQNFGPIWLRALLRVALLPWGTGFRPPTDQAAHALAAQVQTDDVARRRVIRICGVETLPDQALGRLEAAFQAALATASIVRTAEPTPEGAAALSGALDQIWEAIQVDQFSRDLKDVRPRYVAQRPQARPHVETPTPETGGTL